MSADNWAVCPRCAKRELERVEKLEADVKAQYGQIPIEEWDELRQQAESARETYDKAFDHEVHELRTFREDYEFFMEPEPEPEGGPATVGVVAKYSGSCSTCGLSLRFRHVEPLEVGT